MASPTQLVQFTFAAGIDQSQRHEVLDPSSGFLLRQNLRQKDRGAAGRRDGFTYQTLARLDATNRSAGAKLFAHGSDGKQVCVIDGSTLDVYSPSAGANISRGRVSPFGLSMLRIPGPSLGSYTFMDGVVCGSYWVGTYLDDVNVWAFVIDATTGAMVRAPELVVVGTSQNSVGLLGTYGTKVLLFVRSSADANVQWSYLDTASASTLNAGWTAAANLRTDGRALGGPADYNFSVESFTDHVAIVYGNNSAGTDRLTIATVTTAGVVNTATVNTASNNPVAISLAGNSGDTMWLGWNQSQHIYIQGFSTSTTISTTATAANVMDLFGTPSGTLGDTGCLSIVPTTTAAGVVYANDDSGGRLRFHSFAVSAGAVVGVGSDTQVPCVFLMSRAFYTGGRIYGMCFAGGADGGTAGLQFTAILADLTESASTVSGAFGTTRPVGVVEPGLSRPPGIACHASVYGSEFWIPVTLTVSSTALSVAIARFSTVDTNRWQSVRRGASTYLSGAMLSIFDGTRVTEAGFVVRPAAPSTSVAGTGITGTFNYVAVYEHVDAAGNWVISGVSLPTTQAAANQTVTVTVLTLTMTARQKVQNDQNVRVTLYRTTNGGTVYYRHSSKANNLASATVTFTDTTSDATLSANAKLYAPSLPGINGGSQDHRVPTGLMHIEPGNGVILGAQGDTLWCSSQDIPGESLWWNPIFTQQVLGEGAITGIKFQDGTFFVFNRRGIFAVGAEPPSDNGAAGGIGTPRKLATDVGCIDARSLVVTERGIFFQSERGIELLTRAQSVEWIGEAVKTSLGTYTVQAATLDSKAGRVYFETSNATALVYDLGRAQWDSVDTRDVSAAVSACTAWDGSAYRYAYLQADGYVRVSWDNGYDHSAAGNTWPVMRGTTGWIKLGGIQGLQCMNRVLLLAKKTTSAATGIALAYDYDESFETATAYTSATTDSLFSSLARVQLGHDVHDDGEGQAIRVDIQDGAPGGTVDTGGGSLGHTWIALTFEGQPRPNAAEVPEAAK